MSAPEKTTLLLGGAIYTPADPFATAMVIEDGTVAWVGSEGAAAAHADSVDEVIDLRGALVTPAFVDAHVHATTTGLALTGLDLSGCRTRDELLDRLTEYAETLPDDAVVLGTGWDETAWPEGRGPTRHDLDAVVGDRPAYLARVDVHSATVSTALLDRLPGVTELAGFHPDGQLRTDAHHVARREAYGSVAADQRRAAQRATLDAAAVSRVARWAARRWSAPTEP